MTEKEKLELAIEGLKAISLGATPYEVEGVKVEDHNPYLFAEKILLKISNEN